MLEQLFAALHLRDLLTSPLAVLDVLLLAVVIYQLLLLVRGTRSANMMIALSALVLFHLITRPGLLSLNAFHTVLGTLLAASLSEPDDQAKEIELLKGYLNYQLESRLAGGTVSPPGGHSGVGGPSGRAGASGVEKPSGGAGLSGEKGT